MGFMDNLLFLRQSRRNWQDTGAIAPSGWLLSRAITREFRRRDGSARVLEVGPGTGVFTRHLIRSLGPEDSLDLVEANKTFASRLRLRIRQDPKWRRVRDQVNLTVGYAPESLPPGPYDFIVSGVPLNNLGADVVERYLEGLLGVLADDGVLSYFEYLAVRPMKGLFSKRAERQRLRGVGRIIRDFVRRHQFRVDRVFLNLPPAAARHLRKDTMPALHGCTA